jgi:hypothetical protein
MAAACALDTIPDELLLAFTRYLDTKGLLNLAVTSKQLSEISQEILYEDVSLDYRRTYSMLCFLRSVIEPPGRVRRTRSLEVEASDREFDQWGFQKSNQLTEVTMDMEQLRRRIEYFWIENDVANRAQWTAFLDEHTISTYVGFLITLLPNIKRLYMRVDGKDGEPMDDVGRAVFNDFTQHLPEAASLQQSRDLTVPYRHLRGLHGKLPQLKALGLNCVDIDEVTKDMETGLTLPHWKLECLDIVVQFEDIPLPEVTEALRWLSKSLGTLNVEMLVVEWREWDDIPPPMMTNYDAFFSTVLTSWPGVRRLIVTRGFGGSVTAPSTDMRPLRALQWLSVPFSVLADGEMWLKDFDLSDWRKRGLSGTAKALPKRLEILEIHEADKNIILWLECFSTFGNNYQI